MNRSWASKAAISWLNQVINERYGIQFFLFLNKNKFIQLKLPGSPQKITFTNHFDGFNNSESNLPISHWNPEIEGWRSALGKPIPAPGLSSLPLDLIEVCKDGYTINYDLLGFTYWMLSRAEEVNRTDLDQYGRFPAKSSHAYRNNYLDRPIVDEWLYILGQVIIATWPDLVLKKNQYRISISHDVDEASRYGFRSTSRLLKAMAGDLLIRKDIKSALRGPLIRLSSNEDIHRLDSANTYDYLMDLSEKAGTTSTFFFICGRTDKKMDADYDIEHSAIRNLFKKIHNRGHEIGIHPSFNTYLSKEMLKKEFARLMRIIKEEEIHQNIWGSRMHFLRIRIESTLRSLAEAGINYDSTLTYPEQPGFRCGTCYEYPAFDPLNDETINIRILPLIAMDASIIAPDYLNLGLGINALSKFQELKNTCRDVDGIFTLLWHNNRLKDPREIKLYEEIILS
tara:strand:- start:924 stop:2285 length:1362 start_codon:yes stop_codon:yes gene_type:complete